MTFGGVAMTLSDGLRFRPIRLSSCEAEPTFGAASWPPAAAARAGPGGRRPCDLSRRKGLDVEGRVHAIMLFFRFATLLLASQSGRYGGGL